MGIVDPVKRGFKVATQSLNLVLVLFVFGAVFNLINVFMAPQAATPPETPPPAAVSVMMILVGLVFVLLSVFVQAGSLGYVLEKIKTGRGNLSTFFSTGGKYYLRLLLLGLLVMLIILAFVLLGAITIAIFGGNLAAVGIGIAIVLAAFAIYIVMLMFLAPYILVAAEQRVLASIRQSISLVRKNLLSVLGIMLILIVIGFILGLLLGIILALLSAAVRGAASQVIFAIFSSLINAFLGVLVTGSFMSFYLDLVGNTSGAGQQA